MIELAFVVFLLSLVLVCGVSLFKEIQSLLGQELTAGLCLALFLIWGLPQLFGIRLSQQQILVYMIIYAVYAIVKSLIVLVIRYKMHKQRKRQFYY